MNEKTKIDWDERLTAFFMGELSEAERREVTDELERNPALRQEARELKAFCKQLKKELQGDAKFSLNDDQRETLFRQASRRSAPPRAWLAVAVAVTGIAAGFVVYVRKTPVVGAPESLVGRPAEPAGLVEKRFVPALAETPVAVALQEVKRVPAARMDMGPAAPKPRINFDDLGKGLGKVSSLKGVGGIAFSGRSMGTDAFQGGKSEIHHPFRRPAPKAESRFVTPAESPSSTFSVDVDTASYTYARRSLHAGRLPPPDAIRIEEFVNYFDYDYPTPQKQPIGVSLEIAPAPWNPEHRLAHVGLVARPQQEVSRRKNFVFLIDTSGSMEPEDRLPLVKTSLRMLVNELAPDDRISIVTYAGSAGLKLPSTPIRERERVLAAIDSLAAGGSTAGAAGLTLAYDVAQENFLREGNNRVLLATDGDFNVGLTSKDGLVEFIKEKAARKVFLTVLGFGTGNLRDDLLEQIADKGQGHYHYVDSQAEAHRILVENGGALETVAKDVKIQVDFNPRAVQSYRLIGYENRALATHEFHDDAKEAGNMGAGQTVTALYEIIPAATAHPGEEIFTLKVRYKEPHAAHSSLVEYGASDTGKSLSQASANFRGAVAAATFAMVLGGSAHAGTANLAMAKEHSAGLAGNAWQEFRGLVDIAARLQGNQSVPLETEIHQVSPGLTQGEISAVLTAHRAQLLACVAKGDVRGEARIHFDVSVSGRTGQVIFMQSSYGESQTSCLTKAIGKWQHPIPRGGMAVRVDISLRTPQTVRGDR